MHGNFLGFTSDSVKSSIDPALYIEISMDLPATDLENHKILNSFGPALYMEIYILWKLGTADKAPLTSIRNLGAWFDDIMSMNDHINKTCSKALIQRTLQH